MLASTVMDGARAALNDIPGDVYSDEVLLPYLKLAWATLQSEMLSNDIQTVHESTAILSLPAGTTVLNLTSTPSLPADLITVIDIYERRDGNDRWYAVPERDWAPLAEQRDRLYSWAWREEEIQFLGATTDRQILIRYSKTLPEISGASTNLPVRGAQHYLELKTAANAAEYVGSNRTRADRLENQAGMELYKFINQRVKSKQDIVYTRRTRRSRTWPLALPI